MPGASRAIFTWGRADSGAMFSVIWLALVASVRKPLPHSFRYDVPARQSGVEHFEMNGIQHVDNTNPAIYRSMERHFQCGGNGPAEPGGCWRHGGGAHGL